MAGKICCTSGLVLLALVAVILNGVECSYFENMASTDRPAHERPHGSSVSRTSLSGSSGRNNPNTAKQPANLKDRLTWLMNTKSGKIWALPNTNDLASRTRPVFHSWYSADSLYPYSQKRVITRF